MEELLADVVNVLVLVVEACGAAVIITGAVWAFARFVWVGMHQRTTEAFVPVRLSLGRFLTLGAGPRPGRRSWSPGRPRIRAGTLRSLSVDRLVRPAWRL